LSKSQEELLMNFDKSTRYETLRTEKENAVEIILDATSDVFRKVLNNSITQIKRINKDDLGTFNSNLCFTACLLNGDPIIVHSYILDWDSKRCRLLHSISLSELIENKAVRAMYGRANRYLHYKDILFFKDLDYKIYDLGGYAYNTLDKKLQGINKFKDGFGGKLIEKSTYEPLFFFYIKELFIKFRTYSK
jgi:lipid II:glycine glycyltransferase (peptidoglycan interpeptide bridge formation enzyme)